MERAKNRTITLLNDDEAIEIIRKYIDKNLNKIYMENGICFFETEQQLPKIPDLVVASLMLVNCYKQYKNNVEGARLYITSHKKTFDIDGSYDSNLNEFKATAKPDELIAILDRGTNDRNSNE